MNDPRPLFDSLEALVRWAVLTAPHEATVRGPAFARWQKSTEREQIADAPQAPRGRPDLAPRPRGLDAAGQIGMLGAFLRSLKPEQQAHLAAKYLAIPPKPTDDSRTSVEDAANRDALGARRRAAVELLAMLLQAELGPDVDLRVWIALVGRFYGHKRVALSRLAEQSGLTRHRIRTAERQAYITLDALAVRTERTVYDRLEKGGVIG